MIQWKITFSKLLRIATGFYLVLALFTQAAWAGCGTLETSCLVIQGNEESQQQCKIKICANANESASDWQLDNGFTVVDKQSNQVKQVTVNDQQGMSIPYTLLKGDYTCYASVQANTVICAEDVSL